MDVELPTIAILNRPIPVPGANLCGRIQVGEIKPPGPTEGIQDRTWWVKLITQRQSDGWIEVTDNAGNWRCLSPSIVAWLE